MLELSLYFVLLAIIIAAGVTVNSSDIVLRTNKLQQKAILVDVALAHWHAAHSFYPDKLQLLKVGGYLPQNIKTADISMFTYTPEDKGNSYSLTGAKPDGTIYYSPYSKKRRR